MEIGDQRKAALAGIAALALAGGSVGVASAVGGDDDSGDAKNPDSGK